MTERYGTNVRFIYSLPYEESVLAVANRSATDEQHELGNRRAEFVQEIWDEHESEVLDLFRKIYKRDIDEGGIIANISMVLPNSFSQPLTIAYKKRDGIETDPRVQRGLLYEIIHELAHHFASKRNEETFFDRLFAEVKRIDLLGEKSANLHYLIHAVEFGIVGELYGADIAEYSRDWKIEKWKDDAYGKSSARLKKDNVPMDKTCLEYIAREVLKLEV